LLNLPNKIQKFFQEIRKSGSQVFGFRFLLHGNPVEGRRNHDPCPWESCTANSALSGLYSDFPGDHQPGSLNPLLPDRFEKILKLIGDFLEEEFERFFVTLHREA
jgi:hypothetical protein